MNDIKTWNHNIAAIGEGALLIWWGIVIMIDPLTIGMGAIGTGLILLGVNASRLIRGIPIKTSTTAIGIIALAWGALDTIFNPSLEVSFAVLLIVVGAVSIVSLLPHPKSDNGFGQCEMFHGLK
jgi:hypothetical protein